MKSKKELFLKGRNQIYCFADNLDRYKKLLNAGARIIQFRNKFMNNDMYYKTAKDMIAISNNYINSLLILNDRFEIAMKLKADGIHIGQSDQSYLDIVKEASEDMIIGVSVDNEQEAIDAEKSGVTYLGAGAIFPTQTKTDAPVIGITGLKSILRAVSIPVVAIGGISLYNIGKVLETGVPYVGIISQINNSPDMNTKWKEFNNVMNRGSI